MTNKMGNYDWASAALAVELCDSADLKSLVKAAKLDPYAGDVSDIDLSYMDLRSQDMSDWDLQNASFTKARVAKANLRGAKLNPESFIDAQDWYYADLDEEARNDAVFAAVKAFHLKKLLISSSTEKALDAAGLKTIGDLMKLDEKDMAVHLDIEPQKISELKEVLEPFRLFLMEKHEQDQKNPEDFSMGWYYVRRSTDPDMDNEIVEHIGILEEEYNRYTPMKRRAPRMKKIHRE